MTDSLGSQLRRQRQRRQLTLEAIAERTKIGITHLRSLEKDDVSQFPPGIFRRSFVRSYAEAIGLDPDEVVADFLAQFPEPEGHLGVAPTGHHGRSDAASKASRPSRSAQAMRLALADESAGLGQTLTTVPLVQRVQALAFDAAAIASCVGVVVILTHLVWAPLAIVSATYYVASTLLLGNTLGGVLAARRADRRRTCAEDGTLDEAAAGRLANPFAASLDADVPR